MGLLSKGIMNIWNDNHRLGIQLETVLIEIWVYNSWVSNWILEVITVKSVCESLTFVSLLVLIVWAILVGKTGGITLGS